MVIIKPRSTPRQLLVPRSTASRRWGYGGEFVDIDRTRSGPSFTLDRHLNIVSIGLNISVIYLNSKDWSSQFLLHK